MKEQQILCVISDVMAYGTPSDDLSRSVSYWEYLIYRMVKDRIKSQNISREGNCHNEHALRDFLRSTPLNAAYDILHV